MSVDLPENHPYAPVPDPVFLQDSADVRCRGGIIGDTELPVGIKLDHDRIQASSQPDLLSIVNRQEDGNERPVREFFYLFS